MIRTTAAPRTSVRIGAAATIGLAGAFALAACAPADTAGEAETTATEDAASTPTPTATTSTETEAPAEDASTSGYADGSYTAQGSYATPESVETISVTVTLDDGVISAVEVQGDPQRPESEEYQGRFIGGISDEVVGRSIDEIQVSRVAGSSLTSGGFNEAIEQIKADAAA